MPYLCSSSPTCVPRANTRMSHASASCRPGAERVAAHRRDRRVARFVEPRVRLLRAQDAVDGRVGVARAGVVAVFDRVGRAAGEHRRVDARRERAAVADHDDRAQVGVVAQLLAERAHLVPHLRS